MNKQPQPTIPTINKAPQPTKRTVETPNATEIKHTNDQTYARNIETNFEMSSIKPKKEKKPSLFRTYVFMKPKKQKGKFVVIIKFKLMFLCLIF